MLKRYKKISKCDIAQLTHVNSSVNDYETRNNQQRQFSLIIIKCANIMQYSGYKEISECNSSQAQSF
jgi:hypothetical protein